MNPIDYLDSVRNLLLTDFRITGHQIVREFEELKKGYIRVRLTLVDGSFLEFSEYIQQGSGNEIEITDYSYHWMNKDGKMLRRWDNTRHHPHLENFPHHIHTGATDEAIPGKPVNIFAVLDEIASNINE